MIPSDVSSPPPTERPVEPPPPDARDRMHQLASALTDTRDVQLLREYLRLRAAIRF